MSKLTKSASNWRMHSIVYCPKKQKDKKETVYSRSQISTEDQREKKFLTVIQNVNEQQKTSEMFEIKIVTTNHRTISKKFQVHFSAMYFDH